MPKRASTVDKERGRRIAALRVGKGLDQKALGELIGVDQSTVSDIEAGAGFNAVRLMALCEALGTSMEFVMKGQDVRAWPFRRVAKERIARLDERDIGIVEGRILEALDDLEELAALPAPPPRPGGALRGQTLGPSVPAPAKRLKKG